MRAHTISTKTGLAACGLMLLAGCGMEGIFVDLLTKEPELVVVQVEEGQIELTVTDGIEDTPGLYLYDLEGNLLTEIAEPTATSANSFLLPIDDTMTGGARRLVAASGNIVLKTIICLQAEDLSGAIEAELSKATTASALVTEALGLYRGDSTDGYAMKAYGLASWATPEVLYTFDTTLSSIEAGIDADDGDEAYAFYTQVQAAVDAGSSGSSGATMFPLAVDSRELISDDFVTENSVDLDGDGSADEDGSAFNSAAIALAGVVQAQLAEEIRPIAYDDSLDYIRVIFTAHTGEGLQDGNCNDIDVCNSKTIQCSDGDTLYFTGGEHEDSPIQDPELHAMLGDWKPNLAELEMFDDGINGGDEVAGDEIYTITFLLPVGMRIGYKYTYGQVGELWTGTEEWSGNQRILEIEDINGDGYVWRDDNVTDEATNKDKYNCYGGCNSSNELTWGDDFNGDGYSDTNEMPIAVEVSDPEDNLVLLTGQCTSAAADQGALQYVSPSRTPKAISNACE